MTRRSVTLLLRWAGATACAAIACAVLARCGDEPPPEPHASIPGAVLEVAGTTVPRADLDALLPYFDTFDPRLGRKAKIRELLAQHLVPLAFARRDFAAERARQRDLAAGLCAVASNYLELRERGALFGGHEPEQPFARSSLPFPVAAFAFDEANLGRASAPIETAQGYVVIAPRDLVPGKTAAGDQCHAFVVMFHTQSTPDHVVWLRDAQAAARDAVTWVDKDLRGALPSWLQER